MYWPKQEDVGRCLKVECTLILNGAEFPPIFAVSSPVSPGILKAHLIKRYLLSQICQARCAIVINFAWNSR